MMDDNKPEEPIEQSPNDGEKTENDQGLEQPSKDEEITQEIAVQSDDLFDAVDDASLQNPPESLPEAEMSEWVNELDSQSGPEDGAFFEDQDQGDRVASHHPTGDPEATGGWWGHLLWRWILWMMKIHSRCNWGRMLIFRWHQVRTGKHRQWKPGSCQPILRRTMGRKHV